MAQIFSRACEHAVLALIFMAKYGENKNWDISNMATAMSMSQHTLGKVLQALARSGLVVSKKGPDGGFRLGRPAQAIPLMTILEVFHEETFFHRCLIGIPTCSDDAPCPLHRHWGPLREHLRDLCATTTIADLAAHAPSSGFTLIRPESGAPAARHRGTISATVRNGHAPMAAQRMKG